MVGVSTNDLKSGMTLELDGVLYSVVEFQHVKPGKGHAFVRSTLRNVRTGAVTERTFRAGEKVRQAIVERREMQYLYAEPAGLVFMDGETYEQIVVPAEALGTTTNYLVEGESAVLRIYGAEVVGSEVPASVELLVTETEPGMKGDRVSGATKPATTQTGLVLSVPLFISPGERIKVDTRTGGYIARA